MPSRILNATTGKMAATPTRSTTAHHMTAAIQRTVQCLSPSGLHRMAYKEWGRPDNPDVVICVHGVTRVSDDFDALAQELCADFRVI